MLQFPQVDGIRQHRSSVLSPVIMSSECQPGEFICLAPGLFPVVCGRISAAQLAPSAFLASAAGCAALSKDILPTRLHCVPSPESAEALALWNAHVAVPPPESHGDCHQKAWDSPQAITRLHHLLENVQEPASRARLLSASCKESEVWLNAPPVSSLGFCMDDDTISIAVSLRLGTPLFHPHPCIQCGVPLDDTAVHALSCRKRGGRHVCHNAMCVMSSVEA